MSTPPPPHVPYSAFSPKARIRMEATRVAAMVDRLPDEIYSQSNPLIQQAALDSFFVNVRLLLEFLEACPQRGDKSASNTLGKGTVWPTAFLTRAKQRKLREYYKDTSKHVVHFSSKRTDQIVATKRKVRAIARTVLALWDEFAKVSSHPLVLKTADLKTFDL